VASGFHAVTVRILPQVFKTFQWPLLLIQPKIRRAISEVMSSSAFSRIFHNCGLIMVRPGEPIEAIQTLACCQRIFRKTWHLLCWQGTICAM